MKGYSIQYVIHHNNYLHFAHSLDEAKNFIKKLTAQHPSVNYKVYRSKKYFT